jgi:hypothetical protein
MPRNAIARVSSGNLGGERSDRERALPALDRDPFEFGHLLRREKPAVMTKTAVLDARERRVRLVPLSRE